MALMKLENRVQALETKLAALESKVSGSQHANAWIDQIHGTFQDTPAYRQAAELGRRWRNKPTPAKSRRRPKTST